MGWSTFLILAGAASAAVVTHAAAEPTAEPTAEGFLAAWTAAREVAIPPNTKVVWTETKHPRMTPEELAAAFAALPQTAPHDPALQSLRHEQWVLESGGVTSTFVLWYADDNHFRLNEDLPDADWTPQIDAVVDGEQGWSYGSDGIVSAVSLDSAPTGRDPRIHRDTIRRVRLRLLVGGMGFGSDKLSLERFDIKEDGAWQAFMSIPDTPFRFDLIGGYNPAHNAYQLRSATITSPGFQDTDGVTAHYTGHTFEPETGTFVAQQIREVDRRGRLVAEMRLDSVESFEPSEFRRVARLPDPAGHDHTRPGRRIKRIDDYRPAAFTTTSFNESGRESGRDDLPGRPARASNWRAWACGGAGLVAAGLIVLRVRRGRV